jgi:DUF2934 family protein
LLEPVHGTVNDLENAYFERISPHTVGYPFRRIFPFSSHDHCSEKTMDTREVHAQHTVEVLERIAAKAAPRIVSKPKVPATGILGQLQMYVAPHISEDRNACIAETAYFIAMHRGFSPGHELQDWLTAENEVDARLIGEYCAF